MKLITLIFFFLFLFHSLWQVQFCPLSKSATCTAYLRFKSAKVCHVGWIKTTEENGKFFSKLHKQVQCPLFHRGLRQMHQEKKVLKLDNKQIGRNLLHTQHCPLKATSKTPSEPEKLPTAAGSRASRSEAEKRGPSVARAHMDS